MAQYQSVDIPVDEGVEATPVSNNRAGKVVVALVALAAVAGVVSSTQGTQSGMTELAYSKSGTRPTLHAYVDAM